MLDDYFNRHAFMIPIGFNDMEVVAKSFIHSLDDIASSYDYFLVYVLIPLESY